MNAQKLFYTLLGMLGLLIIATLAGTYEANNLLQSSAHKLSDTKAESQAVIDQKNQIGKDKRDIATYSDLNKIARTVVPQDKDQAEAVREIVSLAAQSGIPQLTSITFPVSTLGGLAGAATPSTIHTSKGLTQVTAVKGMPGVYDLQITVQQSSSNLVPYSTFTTFLSKLEQNRRTAQVSSITISPDSSNPNMISFSLTLDEYVKP